MDTEAALYTVEAKLISPNHWPSPKRSVETFILRDQFSLQLNGFRRHSCKCPFCHLAPDKLYFGTGTSYHVRNLVSYLVFEQNSKKKKNERKEKKRNSSFLFLENTNDLRKGDTKDCTTFPFILKYLLVDSEAHQSLCKTFSFLLFKGFSSKKWSICLEFTSEPQPCLQWSVIMPQILMPVFVAFLSTQ